MSRLRNLADRPFAAAIGFLLLTSGIVTIAGQSLTADALETLVSPELLYGLAVTYACGGALMLSSLVWRMANLEAAALMLIGTGLMIRMVALLAVLGVHVNTVSTSAFYLAFGWACLERFRQILNDEKIIRVHRQVTLIVKEDDGAGSSE